MRTLALGRSVLGPVLLAACLTAGCTGEAPASLPAVSDQGAPRTAGAGGAKPRIRAVTLDAVERPDERTLQRIADLGATHLALVPFGFQPSTETPQIRMHTGAEGDGDWYSETDAGIRALARRADTLGMGLVLKPHLWVGREGQSRLDIAFEEEHDWQRWQAQYRRFLLHYARLAEVVEADLLVIGTELAGTTTARASFWRALIREVRTAYAGRLTYAANWHAEYEAVPFWDALDFVGVQGYFPLSQEEDPSMEALRTGWAAPMQALRRVSAAAGRPVFFTELGYRSAHDAAAAPWRWPGEADAAAPRLQARLFEAFFQTVWPEPWVGGAALWKWHAEAERRQAAGFTPQGKPATEVLRRGFGRSATGAAAPP